MTRETKNLIVGLDIGTSKIVTVVAEILAEVASGGEMSRFLLALKTCLAAADPHALAVKDAVTGRSWSRAQLTAAAAALQQVS